MSAPDTTPSALEEIVSKLHTNRWLAHNYLFGHRHRKQSAHFHPALVDRWFSPHPRIGSIIFRGAAKSTLSEEGLAIGGLHQEFRYGLILGETYQKAVQRLMSISYELESNDRIKTIYGQQRARIWRENVIELKNGVLIQAFGKGQNVRGEKNPFTNSRPDFIMGDDMEDKDSVRTPDARQQTKHWWNHEVIPALENYDDRVRVNGTLLNNDALIADLSRDPEWDFANIPMWAAKDGLDIDPDNPTLYSNWPDRFPMTVCRRILKKAIRDHDLNGLCQEYLCRSMEESTKHFPAEHVAPNTVLSAEVPVFAPRVVIVDPARKGNVIRKNNARTGYMAAARMGRTYWILEAKGKYHTPEQIVDETIRLHDAHEPLWDCLEADGLEEFLWAPFRTEMQRRGLLLPIKALRAPKDTNKDAFILGMSPFWKSGEVKFVGYRDERGDMVMANVQDLLDEADTFPSGLKDVLNCLAYLPQAFGGDAIYGDFSPRHVIGQGDSAGIPLCHHLVFHGDATAVAAVLAAYSVDGTLTVLEDYVFQPSADQVKPLLVAVNGYSKLRVSATPALFKATGGPIVNILKRNGIFPVTGAQPEVGSLTNWMRLAIKGEPAFRVSTDAKWTLKALSGGYCRNVAADGQVFQDPAEGPYRLVGECLESLGRLTETVGLADGGDSDVLMSHTQDGRPYLSLLRK